MGNLIMGKDIGRTNLLQKNTAQYKGSNLYHKVAINTLNFVAENSKSPIVTKLRDAMNKSRRFRGAVSLKTVAKTALAYPDKLIVVAGSVCDDLRIHDMPKVNLCCLKYSASAERRITSSNGVILTLEEALARDPLMKNCIFMRPSSTRREAQKHFGKPGVRGSHVKPYLRNNHSRV